MKSAIAIISALLFSSVDSACQEVTTVENLDLDMFTEASWYIQAQQVVGFQPESSLFCLVATYEQDMPSVPLFGGTTISVNNYGNQDEVNGEERGGPLCARLPDEADTSKLLVAPCNLPNLLAGPYWVVGLGTRPDDSYEWALISGGQPTEEFDDGCTTKENRVNNAGLWLLSRDQVLSSESRANVEELARSQGITLSRMIEVPQLGCNYTNANIKYEVLY